MTHSRKAHGAGQSTPTSDNAPGQGRVIEGQARNESPDSMHLSGYRAHGPSVGERQTFLNPPPVRQSWPKRSSLADSACHCRGSRVPCVTCGAWHRLFRDLHVRRAARELVEAAIRASQAPTLMWQQLPFDLDTTNNLD